MLSTKYLLYLVSFFSISILCSCDKFKQDEGIQWHKPEKRIQQYSWSISKYLVDGIDSTDKKKEFLHNATFRFYINDKNSYIASYRTDQDEMPFAFWGINKKSPDAFFIVIWNNYNAIKLDSTFDVNLIRLGGYYKIQKLSNKTLKLKSQENFVIDFIGN